MPPSCAQDNILVGDDDAPAPADDDDYDSADEYDEDLYKARRTGRRFCSRVSWSVR